jgi:hypothetical protein
MGMNTKSKLQDRKLITRITHKYLPLLALLVVLGLWVGACAPQASFTPTAEPLFPTSTPQAGVSITGLVWHDVCVNVGLDEPAPAGCVPNADLGKFVGNGIPEAGETGLAGVQVDLGQGACPSSGLAQVQTDARGRYSFEGLAPGAYCVSASVGETHLPAVIEPGVWTTPSGGMMELTIPAGGSIAEVDFGWDYLNIPTSPTPVPTAAPSSEPSCLNAAQFIKDVSIPDGARLEPRESFLKTWRLRNDGSCKWTADYDLVFVSGYRLGGDGVVPLTGSVQPGETVDLTVRMAAPRGLGTYTGYWMLRDAEGDLFGVGEDGKGPFWVRILIEPEIDDWRGEYFDNRKLEGDPILIRDDEEINFNWKYDSPSSSISEDNFSARWTRELMFQEGTYRFSVRVDDGARLWVDDRLVIDEWEVGSVRTAAVDLDMSKGKHDVKLEYFERDGKARVHFNIGAIDLASEGGWLATYWFNRTMDSEWGLARVDEVIDFDWGSKSPALGIPKDNFSARWTRSLGFEPGIYRLYALADGGVRVKVDGDTVIDEWHRGNGEDTYTVDIELSGDHDLQVEYFERERKAKVVFRWEMMSPLNHAPDAASDSYEMEQDGVLVVDAPGVLANDNDPDGGSLIAVLVSSTANGDVALNQDGSFIYTPNLGFSGEDTFSYKISDGALSSEAAEVAIMVNALDAPPAAEDDAFSLSEDEPLILEAPGILANDFDPEGEELQISIQDEPSHGTLALGEGGGFEYTPDADYHGEDQFTYRVSDGTSESNLSVVTLHISAVNDTPQAIEDLVAGPAGQSLEIDVLANDLNLGDEPITITVGVEPSQGSIEILEGMIRYMPGTGFVGEDLFEYVITDLDGETSWAVVGITIEPAEG